jgi:hypothetical protein
MLVTGTNDTGYTSPVDTSPFDTGSVDTRCTSRTGKSSGIRL